MNIRTVGLYGLMWAHVSASALPSACLSGYQTVNDRLAESERSLQEAVRGGTVGSLGGVGGYLFCISRLPTAPTLVGCTILFGTIAVVSYSRASNGVEALQLAEDGALIYQVYAHARFGHAIAPDDLEVFFQKTDIEMNAGKRELVLRHLVEMMDEGRLCDESNRPNVTMEELKNRFALIGLFPIMDFSGRGQ